jgi:phage baseplate assembly protein gpV
MAGDLAQMLDDIAELQRRVAGGRMRGRVAMVAGDKVRVQRGVDRDGRPILTPWLHTSNHRGGARERRFFAVGQNVTISTINGQLDEAATVNADAPNEACAPPDHADEAGPEAETYQLGELRMTKRGDLYEVCFGRDGATKLRIDGEGNVTVKGAKLFVDAPLSEFSGDVKARGEVTAMHDTKPVNLSTPTQTNVQPGGGTSGPPTPGS